MRFLALSLGLLISIASNVNGKAVSQHGLHGIHGGSHGLPHGAPHDIHRGGIHNIHRDVHAPHGHGSGPHDVHRGDSYRPPVHDTGYEAPHKVGYKGPIHEGDGYGAPHDEYEHADPNYNFEYAVHDEYHGTNFGHQESRDGYTTKGEYFVHLPDGRVQRVSYYADETGYHPTVTYEGEAYYGDEAPHKSGYEEPHQPGYEAPHQPGYKAPHQPGYKAPHQPGYKAPHQSGYKAPHQSGYKPPHHQPSGYEPPHHQTGGYGAKAHLPRPHHGSAPSYH